MSEFEWQGKKFWMALSAAKCSRDLQPEDPSIQAMISCQWWRFLWHQSINFSYHENRDLRQSVPPTMKTKLLEWHIPLMIASSSTSILLLHNIHQQGQTENFWVSTNVSVHKQPSIIMALHWYAWSNEIAWMDQLKQ